MPLVSPPGGEEGYYIKLSLWYYKKYVESSFLCSYTLKKQQNLSYELFTHAKVLIFNMNIVLTAVYSITSYSNSIVAGGLVV